MRGSVGRPNSDYEKSERENRGNGRYAIIKGKFKNTFQKYLLRLKEPSNYPAQISV